MKRGRDCETGLTLVEMLVVLAIIGIMTGMVVLGMGNGSDRQAEIEAKRLAARLTLAADEAMVSDRALGLAWDRTGYRFVAEQNGAWRDDDASALEPHRLGQKVTLTASSRSPLPIGEGTPGEFRLSSARGRWIVHFDGATATAAPG